MTGEASVTTVKGSHYWWIPALAGAVMVAGGIAIVVWPRHSIKLFAFLLGLILVIDGVLEVLAALAARNELVGSNYFLASGLISIAFGMPLAVAPEFSARALAIIFGGLLLAAGLVGTIAGATLRRHGVPTGHYLLRGICGVVAGLVIVVWPGVGLGVLITVAAIWFLAGGTLLLIAGVGMSHLEATVIEA